MQNQFINHINNKFSFLKEAKLLVAISGGLDSVVLTHLCSKIKLNIALAHCNFNLRGNESDADESFVLELAEDINVEIFIESFDTENYAKENKISLQMAARDLRYNWFKEIADQLDFDYILTAHHADDNLETFLINLSRGTGLDGLTGIPEINGNIIRPLLCFSRTDIEIYAKINNLKWQQDSSNETTKYLRNKLRHDVIPKLKEVNAQFMQNFNKTQEFLLDSRSIIDDRIDDISEDIIIKVSENEIHFDISKIKTLSQPRAYLYEILNDYGFTEWNDILDLLETQSGKQIFSSSHRLVKDREVLILTENISQIADSILIEEGVNHINTPFGTLFFDEADAISAKGNNIAHLDKDLLKFPLIVRKWEEGDYFYPFGMQGKKKLSKFFKDEKLSLVAKENTWLLCSENNVVWVINKRLDNRYKVTERTKNILKITL